MNYKVLRLTYHVISGGGKALTLTAIWKDFCPTSASNIPVFTGFTLINASAEKKQINEKWLQPLINIKDDMIMYNK